MSSSPAPRLTRKHKPRKTFKDYTYPQAKPFLLQETGDRCAYSLRHKLVAGETNIEVDHFNPKLKGKLRHRYENLLPAESTCNGSKSNFWPTAEQSAKGIRLINPFEELDYGHHIYEDPETHRVFGVTPTGKFHVLKLKLNADHFVEERRLRHAMRAEKGELTAAAKGAPDSAIAALKAYKEQVDRMIPPIPLKKPPSISP